RITARPGHDRGSASSHTTRCTTLPTLYVWARSRPREGLRLAWTTAALYRLVQVGVVGVVFFFSSRRRHTRLVSDWSSDVCSSDLGRHGRADAGAGRGRPRPQGGHPLRRRGAADPGPRRRGGRGGAGRRRRVL